MPGLKKKHTTTWNLVFMRPTGRVFLIDIFFPPNKSQKLGNGVVFFVFSSTPQKKDRRYWTCQRNCDECPKIGGGGFGSSTLMDGIWTFQWKGKKPGIRYLGQLFFFLLFTNRVEKKHPESPRLFLWTFGSANVTLDQPVIFRVPPGAPASQCP